MAGSIGGAGSGVWGMPGLIAPESMTVSFSGMVAAIGLIPPWAIINVGGVHVNAHGTQTGADTQTYSVDFTPLVPSSGSLTAYLAATITTILQGPFPIPGPPPGQPAYDPTFTPTIGYATSTYSVALSAVTGGINNVSTFELLRTVLTSGQTSVTAWNTAGQFRAANRLAWPASVLTSGGLLSAFQAETVQVFSVSGVTATLPPVSGAGGLMFGFVNPLSVTGTIAAAGTDVIMGSGVAGLSSLVVVPSGSVMLWADASSPAFAGEWQIMGVSPNMLLAPTGLLIVTGSMSWTVPLGVTSADVEVQAGGGGSGGTDGTFLSGCGGAGGYARKRVTGLVPSSSQAVVVGAAGAPGSSGSGHSGGSGGLSSFGGTVIASGGGGGGGTNPTLPGGTGGAAAGGDINVTGGCGSQGNTNSAAFGMGLGGASFFGGGGQCLDVAGNSAGSGQAFGSGGGGVFGASPLAGYPGAPGVVTIRWP